MTVLSNCTTHGDTIDLFGIKGSVGLRGYYIVNGTGADFSGSFLSGVTFANVNNTSIMTVQYREAGTYYEEISKDGVVTSAVVQRNVGDTFVYLPNATGSAYSAHVTKLS